MSQSDRKTILIVDDTPTNIGIISSVLKDSFRTKVATNGEKALVLASAGDRPHLILLDITMPGMDGYEVCRRLKANPATREIPVIFLTAKTEADDEKQGFEVGAVDYIHKPFSAPTSKPCFSSSASVLAVRKITGIARVAEFVFKRRHTS